MPLCSQIATFLLLLLGFKYFLLCAFRIAYLLMSTYPTLSFLQASAIEASTDGKEVVSGAGAGWVLADFFFFFFARNSLNFMKIDEI